MCVFGGDTSTALVGKSQLGMNIISVNSLSLLKKHFSATVKEVLLGLYFYFSNVLMLIDEL